MSNVLWTRDPLIEIKLYDNNLKPDWVSRPAQNTEFHVKRKKENLLVVIGESWTYGETLRDIATAIGRFNLETQIAYTMGPRMAEMLDTDLYQYAVPGNCNFYMFTELDRILKYVTTLNYKKIFVVIQMTEPSREQTLCKQMKEFNHPLAELIKPEFKITFTDWLIKYDDIFFDQYEQIISKYENLDCLLWKNFCRINSPNADRKFKIVNKTWIQYSASVSGKKLDAPSFYSVGWLDNIMDVDPYRNVVFDRPKLAPEIDIIEQSNNFIKNNNFHNNHPNEYGHLLWAQYLIRQAGWKDDI